jgi:hypothetical protein
LIDDCAGPSVVATSDKDSLPDDSFFEQLMKMQGTRIEDQRSSLPGTVSIPHTDNQLEIITFKKKVPVAIKSLGKFFFM